ncbi:MAG: zinc-dependent alcohol dehydrogenase family protein [Bifidobacteriaceae bacterium]|jgi:alcohol dehydrogenase|nr:zinc-dependent alcohol dehydrogenase family protein [Bifidobacteriaceae bacterium]
MKALVYHGPGEKAWEEVPEPTIEDPNDVIVKIDTTTICGSDLHILKGDVPTVEKGRILGHEGVGTVVAVGSGVAKFKVGHRVVINCITTCGTCAYCRVGHPSHCESAGGVGWLLGHLVDGTQAEYVRIPFGETSLHSIPQGLTDEEVIFVSDIIPTGYEMGVLNGQVKPGDDVVVIGAGPVGLAAMVTAQLKSPRRIIAVDLDDFRLAQAVKNFGANRTVNSGQPGWIDQVKALCRHGGADVVMEAVGIPPTLEAAFELVRPTGRIANIGVHGAPVTMPIDRLWIENITMTMGLVDAVTAPMLIELIEAGRLNVRPLATHRFKLDDMMAAYDVFGHAAKNDALKVVIQA